MSRIGKRGIDRLTELKDFPKTIEPGKFVRGRVDGKAVEFAEIVGGGDMLKSVYDENDDGIIDTSDVRIGKIQYKWIQDERGRVILEER